MAMIPFNKMKRPIRRCMKQGWPLVKLDKRARIVVSTKAVVLLKSGHTAYRH